MRGFGFKDNGFFICTETTPRCYVIQEVSDVGRAYSDINKNAVNGENTASAANGENAGSSPYIPFLPWWFTSECRQQLLNVSPQGSFSSTNSPYEPSNTPEPPGRLSPEQLYSRLKNQLEYYFSRENLMNDRYLRSQMDADQYVFIKTVSGFPKIAKLTNDFELIVKVLKESNQVQVDETGTKVRPSNKRCTIILREIPEDAKDEEVKSMFDGCVNYQSLSYGLNNSWYVTFATEEDTQKAFVHLQNIGKKFNNKPVYARIKTGGAPIVTDSYQFGAEDRITTNAGTAYKTNVGISPGGETIITGQITIHDVGATNGDHLNNAKIENDNFLLGQILASYGYVPRASFRPSVTSTAAMNAAQGDSASTVPAFSTPTVPASMPISVGGLQSKFLTPRTLNINNKATKSSNYESKQQPQEEKQKNYAKKPASLNQNKYAKVSYDSNKVTFSEKEGQSSESQSSKAPPSTVNNNVNTVPKPRQGNLKWKVKDQSQPKSEKSSQGEPEQSPTQFGETDFPCLIEEEVRIRKTPAKPEKERVSFSSVVARREGPPPPKQEDRKKTYAQTVKKNF